MLSSIFDGIHITANQHLPKNFPLPDGEKVQTTSHKSGDTIERKYKIDLAVTVELFYTAASLCYVAINKTIYKLLGQGWFLKNLSLGANIP